VRLATIGDAQRLGMQQLGDGKRVMEFDQIEIVGTETRLRIGRARRPLGDLGPRHVAIARRESSRPDHARRDAHVRAGEPCGHLLRAQHNGGRPVAVGAAVQETQRIRDRA
jgi:hypothetical protein